MKPSRLVLVAGVVGALYTPAAFAAPTVDMIWSTTDNTVTASGETLTWPQTLPANVTGGIRNIVMPDESMQMTRATFTQMVVDHLYTQERIDHCYWDITSPLPPTFTLLYTDVPASQPYGKELCIAMRDGLAQGYKDGSFRPNQLISFAEASKIIANAYSLAPYAEINRPKGTAWFAPYAFALAQQKAIPATVTTFYHTVTAGEVMTMLNRLSGNITWETSSSYDALERNSKPVQKKAAAIQQTSATAPAVVWKQGTTGTHGSTSSLPASMPTSASTSSALPWYKLF